MIRNPPFRLAHRVIRRLAFKVQRRSQVLDLTQRNAMLKAIAQEEMEERSQPRGNTSGEGLWTCDNMRKHQFSISAPFSLDVSYAANLDLVGCLQLVIYDVRDSNG